MLFPTKWISSILHMTHALHDTHSLTKNMGLFPSSDSTRQQPYYNQVNSLTPLINCYSNVQYTLVVHLVHGMIVGMNKSIKYTILIS